MLGGGPYEATTCPECGSTIWNGRCENPDCKYHWHPEGEEDEYGYERQKAVPEMLEVHAGGGEP